jgi:uncharacterized surface protein with fasciclin (FAS1) repeats
MFTTFNNLIDSNWTVFLPTMEAIQQLDRSFFEELADDPSRLEEIVDNHLIENVFYTIAYLNESLEVSALSGNTLRLSCFEGNSSLSIPSR